MRQPKGVGGKADPESQHENATTEYLADLKIWAPCTIVTVTDEDGSERKLKVSRRKCGRKWGRVNNPDDWMRRKTAEKIAERLGPKAGVGIRLGKLPDGSGRILAGVDNDSSRKDGISFDWEVEIVEAFNTHCHVSPSGNGTHLLFIASQEDLDSHKKSGLIKAEYGRKFGSGDHVEIAVFYGGKFFSFTDQLVGAHATIRRVSRETQAWLLEEFGPNWALKLQSGRGGSNHGHPTMRALPRDDSGSGYGFRYCMRAILSEKCDRDEAPEVCSEFFEMIDPDHPAAEWWWRATDRDRERTPMRAWDAAQARWNDADRCDAFLNMLDEE